MRQKEKANIIVKICNGILLDNKYISVPKITGLEWDEVMEMSSRQGVLPVVVKNLNEAPPNGGTPMVKEQLLHWIGVTLQNEQNYKMRMYVMRELAKLFDQEGIDIMFFKGASLAQMYPNPEWRVFSDVDYYLFGESERGIKILAERGIENSEYYHHHTQASFNGVLIENHYDFVERVNHKCDIVLDDALKELAEEEGHSVKAAFLGEDVGNAYLMTPTMNAIFLMSHMSAHFVSETVSMRMLYDWALFLMKFAGEVDWNYVMLLYEKSGMMKFVEIIMTILKNHLEFDCPICPVELGTEVDAERVWESIINPPEPDPHDKYTLRYYLFEAKTFITNRWKHKLVYPGESFLGLFFKYVKLGLHMMIIRH